MSRYLDMFSSVVADNIISQFFAEQIVKDAKKEFIKHDRITWYLRLKRLMVIHNVKKTYELSEVSRYFKGIHRDDIALFKKDSEAYMQKVLCLSITYEHCYMMSPSSIDSLVFEHQPMSFLEEHNIMLDEKLKLNKQRECEEYGIPIMSVGDLTWFNLQKQGCAIEGACMSHCGNGYGYQGQNIFSLRSKSDRNGYWRPHVTVLFSDFENGVTSEIKGYGNQKPSERYHDALVALVLSDYVTRMAGGGYLPHENFDLSDLTYERAQTIILNKPALANPLFAYEVCKAHDSQLALQQISAYTTVCSPYGPIVPHMEVFNGSVEAYADEHKLTSLAYYVKELTADCCEYSNDYFEHIELDEVFAKLLEAECYKQDTEILKKYCKDRLTAEGVDVSNLELEAMVTILAQEYDDANCESILDTAKRYGDEAGFCNEVYEAVYEHFSLVGCEEFSNSISTFYSIHEPFAVLVPATEIMGLLLEYARDWEVSLNSVECLSDIQDDALEEILESLSDLSVPYCGFNGFDVEAALDGLTYEITEQLGDIQNSVLAA